MKTKKLISQLFSTSRSLLNSRADEDKLKPGSHAIHGLLFASLKKHRRLNIADPGAKTMVLVKTINTHKLIR